MVLILREFTHSLYFPKLNVKNVNLAVRWECIGCFWVCVVYLFPLEYRLPCGRDSFSRAFLIH